jgi:hypothetical protein
LTSALNWNISLEFIYYWGKFWIYIFSAVSQLHIEAKLARQNDLAWTVVF